MAHWEQRDFVQKIRETFPQYFNQSKVLEVGSLNINGTIRDFFTDCKYIGIDVSPGDGVDVVCEGQNYNPPDNSYDVVCSAECFEHNPYWFETFQNMIRLCKNGGLVLFTCATDGRAEHGTSKTTPADSPLTIEMGWDYYQNLNETDFRDRLNFDLYFKEYQFEVNDQSHDLYFWGIVEKNNLDPIPVIGVPIVNGFHWLERLVESIDYPVNDLVIIDNNGRGELTSQIDEFTKRKFKYIDRITATHLPHNIGCSGAWNLIIKCYMNAPYWIIVNNDVAFTPGCLQEMVDQAKDNNIGVVKPKSFQWDLFLIKDWVVQQCGLFDENFYPAYMEDCDYYMRLLNKSILIGELKTPHLHGNGNYENDGSQTLKIEKNLSENLHYAHEINSAYMTEKWGPTWRGFEWEYFFPWKTPYDKEDIPITYTKFDLEFCRDKNLGF